VVCTWSLTCGRVGIIPVNGGRENPTMNCAVFLMV
jgi:hypothetical protein